MSACRTILRIAAYCGTLILFAFLVPRQSLSQSPDYLASIVFTFPQREAAPDSFYLVIEQDFEAIRYYAKTDTVSVPAGDRHLTIIEADSKDAVIRVNLIPGDTLKQAVSLSPLRNPKERIRHSANPVIDHDANLYIITDSDTHIYLDGERASLGELVTMSLDSTIVVEARHSELGSRRKRVSPRPDRMAVLELFHRPDRSTAMKMSLLPGGGHLYKRQSVRAVAAAGLIVGTLGYGIKLAVDAHGLNKEYKLLSLQYYGTPNELIAVELGDETMHMYNRARDVSTRRNVVLGTAAGLYILSIIDAAIAPRGGFRPTNEKQIDWSVGPTINGVTLNVTF